MHNKQFRITLTNKKLACQHLGPAPSPLERAGGEVKAGTQYRMQNENLKREIDARSLSFAIVNLTVGSGYICDSRNYRRTPWRYRNACSRRYRVAASNLTRPELLGITIFNFVFAVIYLGMQLVKKKVTKAV